MNSYPVIVRHAVGATSAIVITYPVITEWAVILPRITMRVRITEERIVFLPLLLFLLFFLKRLWAMHLPRDTNPKSHS
jgi:hypothetical protein